MENKIGRACQLGHLSNCSFVDAIDWEEKYQYLYVCMYIHTCLHTCIHLWFSCL